MNCKLISLKLRNFKGFESYDFEPTGHSVVVHGTNGAGKTTLADAWSWLLFGKDSRGSSTFDIKPLIDGEPVDRHAYHSVEAIINVGDRELQLKREFTEIWAKRRGSARRVASGHRTNFWLGGVPKTAGEYSRAIDKIILTEKWRLLSDPAELPERWEWKSRRALLIEICGGISREEVVESDPALSRLPEVLGSNSLEDQRRILAATIKKKGKDRDSIPARIGELATLKGNVPCGTVAEAALELKRLQKRRSVLDSNAAAHRSSLDSKAEELRSLRFAIAEADIAAKKEYEDADRELVRAWHAAEDTAGGDALCLMLVHDEHAANLEARARALGGVDDLERSPAHGRLSTCAACGQALPSEQAEELAAQAKIELDRRQASWQSLEAVGRELVKKVAAAEAASAQSNERSTAAKMQLDSFPALAASGKSMAMMDRELALVADLDAMEMEELVRSPALDAEITSQQQTLSVNRRIENLRAKESQLSIELETAEGDLYLIDKFTRARVKLLEDKINAMFESVSFRMFKQLINGSIEERCDVMARGVPYSSALSQGERMRAGLEIIRVLQAHFNFASPVWVDGAESLVELPAMGCQMIALRVSGQDKQLRIERVNE